MGAGTDLSGRAMKAAACARSRVNNPFFARVWPFAVAHEAKPVRVLRRENLSGLSGRVLENRRGCRHQLRLLSGNRRTGDRCGARAPAASPGVRSSTPDSRWTVPGGNGRSRPGRHRRFGVSAGPGTQALMCLGAPRLRSGRGSASELRSVRSFGAASAVSPRDMRARRARGGRCRPADLTRPPG